MREREVSLVDIELERVREWEKYLRDPLGYAKKIKEVARMYDKGARVLLFGSRVSGGARPDSDVDVLTITEAAKDLKLRLRIRVEIAKEVGELAPFEVHIVTPRDFEGWYKRFLREYREV